MTNTTAFLIFKDMQPYIEKLTNEETGEVFKAIFDYVNHKPLAQLSHTADIVFAIFKKTIDENEERYKKKAEANKRYRTKGIEEKPEDSELSQKQPQSKKTPQEEPANEKTAIKGENQGDMTREQCIFYLNFQKDYPKKAVDCKISDYPNIDYQKLFKAIKQSDFLSNSNNLTLKWCLENSTEIIAGNYRNYEKPTKANFTQRSDEAYRSYKMPSIEDIEI